MHPSPTARPPIEALLGRAVVVAALLLWGLAAVDIGMVAPPATKARWLVLMSGAAVATLSPRFGAALALALAPLLPFVERSWLPHGLLSLSHELVIGVMAGIALRCVRQPKPLAQTPVLPALALFVMSVLAALVLRELCPDGPAADRVVHHALVIATGAVWFCCLLAYAPLSARDLYRTLLGAALVLALVVVVSAPPPTFAAAAPDLHHTQTTFNDRNTVAAYLVLLLPIGWVVVQQTGGRLAAIAWLGVLTYALMATASRSAWLGCLAALSLGAVGLARRPEHHGFVWLRGRAAVILGVATILALGGLGAWGIAQGPPGASGLHCYLQAVRDDFGLISLGCFAIVLLAIRGEIRRALAQSPAASRQRLTAIAVGLIAIGITMLAHDSLRIAELQFIFWAVVAAAALERQAYAPE